MLGLLLIAIYLDWRLGLAVAGTMAIQILVEKHKHDLVEKEYKDFEEKIETERKELLSQLFKSMPSRDE